MPTSKNISNLVINKVDSQAVYNSMKNRGLINEDELYLVNDTGNSSIDASSITGLDTYLNNKGYVKFVNGSYVGDTSNGTYSYARFDTIEELKRYGRQITLPFSPYVIYLSSQNTVPGDTLVNNIALHQNESDTTSYADLSVNASFTYNSAYLEGNILYVAHASKSGSSNTLGYNYMGKTYYWEISDCELF